MQKLYNLILFLCLALSSMGQTHSSADRLFTDGNYTSAQDQYGKLLRSYPTNALYLYRYARCAQELGDHDTAIEYFQKAGDRYMLKYFYLGEIYMERWDTEQAILCYQTYIKSQQQPNERFPHIYAQIARAEKLQRYLRRVEQLSFIDSTLLPIDQLLTHCTLSPEAGQLRWKDTTLGFNYTNQRDEHRIWASRVDSSTMLLSSRQLIDHWTTPDTMPITVNFTTQQLSPYLLVDGVTLYFAAKDTNGLGGLDIYVTRYNTVSELYTTPENLGMPYNSPANEYFLILDEGQNIGYLATDRRAPQGYAYLYSFVIPEQKQYLRGLPNDSLVSHAQLRTLIIADTTSLPSPTLIDTTETTSIVDKQIIEQNIHFILNDSTIYTTLQDFHSTEAQSRFLQWQTCHTQWQKTQVELSALRVEFSESNADRQKELTPVILQLEKNQSQLSTQCYQLLYEVRSLEFRALLD